MTTQETQVKDTKATNSNTAKPPVAATETAGAGAAPAEEKEKRASRKVYIVVGSVLEFKSVVDAEKFLNTDPGAPTEFTVIRGAAVAQKQCFSLR
jgi:hypothetical protein